MVTICYSSGGSNHFQKGSCYCETFCAPSVTFLCKSLPSQHVPDSTHNITVIITIDLHHLHEPQPSTTLITASKTTSTPPPPHTHTPSQELSALVNTPPLPINQPIAGYLLRKFGYGIDISVRKCGLDSLGEACLRSAWVWMMGSRAGSRPQGKKVSCPGFCFFHFSFFFWCVCHMMWDYLDFFSPDFLLYPRNYLKIKNENWIEN